MQTQNEGRKPPTAQPKGLQDDPRLRLPPDPISATLGVITFGCLIAAFIILVSIAIGSGNGVFVLIFVGIATGIYGLYRFFRSNPDVTQRINDFFTLGGS